MPLLAQRVSPTKHHERVREALSGPQSGTVLVAVLDDAVAVADAYAAEHLEIQTRDAAAVAGADPQRRRGLRRPVLAGVARRLLRRVQPRAADRRLRAVLRRAERDDLPAADAGDRLLARRAGGGGAARAGAVGRRGPARARRGRRRPVRRSRRDGDRRDRRRGDAGRPAAAGRPGRPLALRRAAAGRAGADQHQREPLPAVGMRWSPTWPRRSPPSAVDAEPLPGPGRGGAAREQLARLPAGVDRDRRCRARTSGRPTVPTRSCCSCCRRSPAPAAARWASSRRTRCTRSSPPAPGPPGCPARAAATSPSTSTPPPRRSPSAHRTCVFLTSPNNPTGGSLPLAGHPAGWSGPRRASWWSTRRTRSSPTGPARSG